VLPYVLSKPLNLHTCGISHTELLSYFAEAYVVLQSTVINWACVNQIVLSFSFSKNWLSLLKLHWLIIQHGLWWVGGPPITITLIVEGFSVIFCLWPASLFSCYFLRIFFKHFSLMSYFVQMHAKLKVCTHIAVLFLFCDDRLKVKRCHITSKTKMTNVLKFKQDFLFT